MSENRFRVFRSERARELMELRDILVSESIIPDPGPIEKAITDCTSWIPYGKYDLWGYRIRDLLIPKVEDLSHVRPRSVRSVNLYLSIELVGKFEEDDFRQDRLVLLSMDFILTDENGRHTQSWHFDRHLKYDTPSHNNANPNAPTAAHPDYHFQHGGRHVWDFEDGDYANMLILDPPRIAHPPMDAILGFDFLLSNYFGEIWCLIGNSNEAYLRLVEKQQLRYWQPYYKAISSTWEPPTGVYEWDPELLCPQIIRELN